MRIFLSITLIVLTFAFGAVSYLGSAQTAEFFVRTVDPVALQTARTGEAVVEEVERMTDAARATTAAVATGAEIAGIHAGGAGTTAWQVYTEVLADAYGSQLAGAAGALSLADEARSAVTTGTIDTLSTTGAYLIYGAGEASAALLQDAETSAYLIGHGAYTVGAAVGASYDAGSAWLTDAQRGFENAFSGTAHTKKICVEKSDGSEICVNGDDIEALLGSEE